MDWELLFSVAGQSAMAGWVILVFGPRRWPVLNALPRFVLPGILSVGYSVLILVYFGRVDGGFGSLTAVKALFLSDPVLLAGWVHYLAFDLFVGAWIARHADRTGISRLVQAPILAATFLFGPFGLLAYLFVVGTWLGSHRLATREA